MHSILLDIVKRPTTQQEPALTASLLAAVLLASVARCLRLTDDDLAILGPVAQRCCAPGVAGSLN